MLRIGICEDDSGTREELHNVISQTLFPYTEMEFVYYEDGDEVMAEVMKGEFKLDLLLLDVHMKKMDGMKTADMIRKHGVDVDIIFMTVSGDHVFEGYKYKAFAYCLKPVESSSVREVLIQYMEEKKDSSDCINVAINGKRVRIPLNRIKYFESEKRRVTAHTLTEDYTFYAKLDEIEDMLAEEKFFRCHQSYIVNRDMIDSMIRTEIVIDGVAIPVSRKYYKMNHGWQEDSMKIQVTKSLAMNREEAGALVFTKGKLLGSIIRIRDEKVITIGRDAALSDVVINTKTVSRLHCKVIYHRASGNYTVIDCSKNGVYLSDGSELPTSEEVEVDTGEELWLGDADNIVRLG